MKPTKPCANCGVVPRMNQAGGLHWIDCKNPACTNPMHQRDYHPTPGQAIAAWDAPRWYEPASVDEVPSLDSQRRGA